jgi:hypothetical protein
VTDRAALLATLEAAAAEPPEVTSGAGDEATIEWTRAGVRFAILRDTKVDLRVGSLIAAAAVRTPDTSASDLGPEWVTFAPSELDSHAVDRLKSWFAAAHRRAAPGDR